MLITGQPESTQRKRQEVTKLCLVKKAGAYKVLPGQISHGVHSVFGCPKHKSLMEDTLFAGYAKNRNAVGHKKIEVRACALNVL